MQNIVAGSNYLQSKSAALWIPGNQLCIDEGRIVSKSKRNPFKTRNPDKPIRMGWTVDKIPDCGEHGGYSIFNHLVKVGKYTYIDTHKGKNYKVVDQLTEGLKNKGKMIVLDRGYPTVNLLNDSKSLWGTRIIATQGGKTAHIPKRHKEFLSRAKRFPRGLSQSLHHGDINITYWNDNNAVCFLDNDISSAREEWQIHEIRSGRETSTAYLPKVAAIYKDVNGWVDRTNQMLSYYNTECRSIRKQSLVFDNIIEMYCLQNSYTLWRNSPNLFQNVKATKKTSAEYRFDVVRAWYAECKMHNGRPSVLHYGGSKKKNKRTVQSCLMSPRKGKCPVSPFSSKPFPYL